MGNHRLLKLVGTLAVSAASIYAANWYINQRATENKILKAQADDFIDWNGLKVYCKKVGTGEPLVLLHHLHPACSADDWAPILDALSANHSVYLVDLPGCGRSDKPETTYTNFYYVQFLIDLIKNNIGKKAYVIASGDACPVALMAAAYDATKIAGISFLAPPALADCAVQPTRNTRIFKEILSLPLIGRLVYNFLYSRDSLDSTLCEKFFYNPFLVDEEIISRFHESAHLQEEGGRFLAASLIGNYVNLSAEHALRTLSVPAQILRGVPTGESVPTHSWAELQPSISLRGIEKSALLMQIEQPESVADAILEQLS